MGKNRRNRVALLGALLVTGLVLAGLGTALGVGEAFQEIGKAVSVVGIGDQVTVYEDGKVIDNFTLPEGGNYTWETSDHAIHIFTIPKEEMEKIRAESEAEKNKLLEIAKNDSRVQQLIDGKDYKVIGVVRTVAGQGEYPTILPVGKGNADTAILTLDVEGKHYEITIDMNSETVESIEEQSSGRTSVCYGPGCETHEIHRPEGLPPIPSVPK